MLSSDILEEQFGETSIVVVKQNDEYRIIKTVASSNNQTLELSLVSFDKQNIDQFANVHQSVLAGKSMGKAFRNAGVPFVRKVLSVSQQVLPAVLQSQFENTDHATVVIVDIFVGRDEVHYAHIVELYSPIVKWPEATTSTGEYSLEDFARLM